MKWAKKRVHALPCSHAYKPMMLITALYLGSIQVTLFAGA